MRLPLPPSPRVDFGHPRIREYPTIQELHHIERRPNHVLVLTQHYWLWNRDDLVWECRGGDVMFMEGVEDSVFAFNLMSSFAQ